MNAGGFVIFGVKSLTSTNPRQVSCFRYFENASTKVNSFYNFPDYELEILKTSGNFLGYGFQSKIAEWNGHKHEPGPKRKSWVYLVQYTPDCEGWNCITTTLLYSTPRTYSYKGDGAGAGRIDRLMPYTDLYLYHEISEWD